MDRDDLEEMLRAGMSLEEIGRRHGRHSSTVAYWIEKHALRANGRDVHAPKGGLGTDQLRALVDADQTVAEIAAQVGRSPTTVRYWLHFHGLQTTRSARQRASGVPGTGAARAVTRTCRTHGVTDHVLRGKRYRCRRCASDAVTRCRRQVKRRLVHEAGGSCRMCGYDRRIAALEFHHIDPSTKRFPISLKGVARAFDTVREEAATCVLLCANCHAEVEAGVSILPPVAPGRG